MIEESELAADERFRETSYFGFVLNETLTAGFLSFCGQVAGKSKRYPDKVFEVPGLVYRPGTWVEDLPGHGAQFND